MKTKILVFTLMILILTMGLINFIVLGRMLQAEYMMNELESDNGALQVKLESMRDELENLRARNQ